ncbi:MAG TPA: M43 family zinc metalloprotease [Chitinophagaceae bacterium]|nr:M43 family zinc metalloprotease [Chitinophagaceae bacterium]
MKKNTIQIFIAFFLLGMPVTFSQQSVFPGTNSTIDKCGTQLWLNNMNTVSPGYREQYLQNEKLLGDAITKILKQENILNLQRTAATINIPVVFHVVVSNQATVPDAMILAQLNRLNLDFAGLNADSANGAPFYSVRGHSKIQFCLAQRTPANISSNGIVRITSSVKSSLSAGDPVKYTAQGGSSAWDTDKYINIWIANLPDGFLGYGTFPGSLQAEQGVVVLAGTLPGGDETPYNNGRTLIHELGHYFWLLHPWGSTSCADDFPNTPGIDDTPLQADPTYGCPVGVEPSGCSSPSPPGRMYQNFMDYTDDGCMSMFTNGQNLRADQAIVLFRSGLLSSNGCQPVVPLPNDASISSILTPQNFADCLGPSTPLSVSLHNPGSNVLTAVTITVELNNVLIQTYNWTGSLAPGATTIINLNTVNLIVGQNTIVVCTKDPNGFADSVPSNDCKIAVANGSAIQWPLAGIPLSEGFEGSSFPPANWTRQNPDNNLTWQRNTTDISRSGNAKAFINHFNYLSVGQTDDLISPNISIGIADSLWVSFWAAYKGQPNNSFEIFQVAVSTNCGNTFTNVYNNTADQDFAEPPVVSATSWSPSAISQWKRKSIDLSSLNTARNLLIRFRMINQKGNNFYLDDIQIDKKIFQNIDAGVVDVINPKAKMCVNSTAPVVVIKNFGKNNLTSANINYQVDGSGPVRTIFWFGNLVRNQTATITLPVANLGSTGNHTLHVYTSEPNNVADQDPTNDRFVKAYQVFDVFALQEAVTEEFTNPAFPPPNWNIYNPDADITWARHAGIGKRNPGSAWFNDFANNTVDRFDDLLLPNYSYTGIDSVFMTFNLATISKTVPGTPGARYDTLSVLLSKDCGNTFQSIYKKYGAAIQTVNFPLNPTAEFFPAGNQWRLDSLDLGNWLSGTEPLFQLGFRFHGNTENNLFLDDVTVRTEILPDRLKRDGYILYPVPFRNKVNVWHFRTPFDLVFVNVYNAYGQLVWARKVNGNAGKVIEIDLSSKASGMYTVSLGYEDTKKNVSIPVVKY